MNGVYSEIDFGLPQSPGQNPLGKRHGGKNSAPEAQIGATQSINREPDKPSGPEVTAHRTEGQLTLLVNTA